MINFVESPLKLKNKATCYAVMWCFSCLQELIANLIFFSPVTKIIAPPPPVTRLTNFSAPRSPKKQSNIIMVSCSLFTNNNSHLGVICVRVFDVLSSPHVYNNWTCGVFNISMFGVWIIVLVIKARQTFFIPLYIPAV